MSTSHRRRHASIALALTLTLLAGCNPPSVPSEPTAPLEPQQAGATSPTYITLQGNVSLQEQPWASAKLQVFDALTGEAAAVTPATGALAVDPASLTTDSDGNFSLRVSGLAPGDVLRIVATSEAGTLSALTTSTGGFSGYRVNQTPKVVLDALSTIFDKLSEPLLKLAGLSLKKEAAKTLVSDNLDKYRTAILAKLQSSYNRDPAIFSSVAKSISQNIIGVVMFARIDSDLSSLAQHAVSDIVNAAKVPTNRNPEPPTETGTTIAFPGTRITAVVSKTGSEVVVTNGSSKDTVTIVLNDADNGVDAEPLAPFGPDVATLSYEVGTLHIKLKQFKGHEDIKTIVTRLPTGSTFGELKGNLLTAYSQVTVELNSRVTMSLLLDDSENTGVTPTLPVRFGGAKLTKPEYDAFLKIKDTQAKVAAFQVFVNRSGYDYLVLSYHQSSSLSLKAQRETHIYTKAITLPGNAALAKNAAETAIESSQFEWINRDKTIQTSRLVTTLAGSTEGFAEGNGSEAKFSSPGGVAVDAKGNVYVADIGNHKIRMITAAGKVTTLAGSTEGFADGKGSNARFDNPTGVAVDAKGNVYVTDSGNHKIRMITAEGEVTTLAGSTQGNAIEQFAAPRGVAVDAEGYVFVADRFNHRISKVTPRGLVSILAGSVPGNADGQGSNARFEDPAGVAVDANGKIYVADQVNHSIRLVTSTGMVSTLTGFTGGLADGSVSTAGFWNPGGLALDAMGNLYVADSGNSRIRIITKEGQVGTLAGSTDGFADGAGSEALFNYPAGVAVDADGNLYVADQSNHKVRKIHR